MSEAKAPKRRSSDIWPGSEDKGGKAKSAVKKLNSSKSNNIIGNDLARGAFTYAINRVGPWRKEFWRLWYPDGASRLKLHFRRASVSLDHAFHPNKVDEKLNIIELLWVVGTRLALTVWHGVFRLSFATLTSIVPNPRGLFPTIPKEAEKIDVKISKTKTTTIQKISKSKAAGTPVVAPFAAMAALPLITRFDDVIGQGYSETFREFRDDMGEGYYNFTQFSEDQIKENRLQDIEQRRLFDSGYDYFDPLTYDYSRDPFAREIQAFGLADYVSRGDNPDLWARTQTSLVAYKTTGIDPRIVATIIDREAWSADTISDNSTARGYLQYLEASWLGELDENYEEILKILRDTPELARKYNETKHLLEILAKPASEIPGIDDNPIYRRLSRSRRANMTAYDFYSYSVNRINTGRETDYKDNILRGLLALRDDDVFVGIVGGLDFMQSTKGKGAFAKTKDLSQEDLNAIVADAYAKHHLGGGSTRGDGRGYAQYKKQLSTAAGRAEKAALHPGFKAAAGSNPYDFYHEVKRERGKFAQGVPGTEKTFAELRDHYRATTAVRLNKHYNRTQAVFDDVSLQSRFSVDSATCLPGEEYQACYDREFERVWGEGSDERYYPNRWYSRPIAQLSDRAPTELSDLPAFAQGLYKTFGAYADILAGDRKLLNIDLNLGFGDKEIETPEIEEPEVDLPVEPELPESFNPLVNMDTPEEMIAYFRRQGFDRPIFAESIRNAMSDDEKLQAKGNADIRQLLKYGDRSMYRKRMELLILFIHMQEENGRTATPSDPFHPDHDSALQFRNAKREEIASYLKRYGGEGRQTYEDYIRARQEGQDVASVLSPVASAADGIAPTATPSP